MISQSENNIKKSALRFLKMYYKNRPRSGETSIKMNQGAAGGIIADGLLFFPTEDGTQFLAAVEATSFDSRDEVKFRMQHTLLYWDSFMAACVLTALFVLIGHYYLWFSFLTGGLELFAFIFGLACFGFLSYRYLFGYRSKYHYIYALEQFKRYHADEQWVAIGDNVFYGPNDPMLEELKKQCVYNGFGLLSVDKELATHLVITPSRKQIFGNTRRILQFIGLSGIADASPTQTMMSWWDILKNTIGIDQMSTSLTRYQRSYYKQVFVSMVMIGLVGFVAYEDLREKDVQYAGEKFQQDIENIKNSKDLTEHDQRIDTPYVKPFSKEIPDSYITIVEEDKREDYLAGRIPNDKLSPKGKEKAAAEVEIVVSSGDENFTSYDCSRFHNFTGKKYIVQDGEFKTLVGAERRLNFLIRKGYTANILWLGCFYKKNKKYAVYIDWIYNSEKEARDMAKMYKRKLDAEKISESDLKIRSIER